MPLISFQELGPVYNMVLNRKILTYFSDKSAVNNVTCFVDEIPPFTSVNFTLINDIGICKSFLIVGGIKDAVSDKHGSIKFVLPNLPTCQNAERTTLFMLKASWKDGNIDCSVVSAPFFSFSKSTHNTDSTAIVCPQFKICSATSYDDAIHHKTFKLHLMDTTCHIVQYFTLFLIDDTQSSTALKRHYEIQIYDKQFEQVQVNIDIPDGSFHTTHIRHSPRKISSPIFPKGSSPAGEHSKRVKPALSIHTKQLYSPFSTMSSPRENNPQWIVEIMDQLHGHIQLASTGIMSELLKHRDESQIKSSECNYLFNTTLPHLFQQCLENGRGVQCDDTAQSTERHVHKNSMSPIAVKQPSSAERSKPVAHHQIATLASQQRTPTNKAHTTETPQRTPSSKATTPSSKTATPNTKQSLCTPQKTSESKASTQKVSNPKPVFQRTPVSKTTPRQSQHSHSFSDTTIDRLSGSSGTKPETISTVKSEIQHDVASTQQQPVAQKSPELRRLASQKSFRIDPNNATTSSQRSPIKPTVSRFAAPTSGTVMSFADLLNKQQQNVKKIASISGMTNSPQSSVKSTGSPAVTQSSHNNSSKKLTKKGSNSNNNTNSEVNSNGNMHISVITPSKPLSTPIKCVSVSPKKSNSFTSTPGRPESPTKQRFSVDGASPFKYNNSIRRVSDGSMNSITNEDLEIMQNGSITADGTDETAAVTENAAVVIEDEEEVIDEY